MVMLESPEKCSKFNIEMEVHESGASREKSETNFRYRDQPCSIDENREDMKYLGLSVNYRGMEKIFTKSEDDSFGLSFRIRDSVEISM